MCNFAIWSLVCMWAFLGGEVIILQSSLFYSLFKDSSSGFTLQSRESRHCRPCEEASSRPRPSDWHQRHTWAAASPPPCFLSARLRVTLPYLRAPHYAHLQPTPLFTALTRAPKEAAVRDSPEGKSVSTQTFLVRMNRPICSNSPHLTTSWKMMSLGKCTVLLAGAMGITGAGFSRAWVRRDELYWEGRYVDADL